MSFRICCPELLYILSSVKTFLSSEKRISVEALNGLGYEPLSVKQDGTAVAARWATELLFPGISSFAIRREPFHVIGTDCDTKNLCITHLTAFITRPN